jgi:hypothetical protein
MPTHAQPNTNPSQLFDILATTLTRALTVSDRRKTDAEDRIARIVASGVALAADIGTTNDSLRESTARLATAARKAYVEAGSWLDRAFNQSARVRRGGFMLAVGGGLTSLRRGPVTQLPLRLRSMADSFERTPPTGTSAVEGLATADGLREHADVIAVHVRDVETATQRLTLLKKGYRTQATLGQQALARLKRLWLSLDFTPAQIHEIIPDSGPRRARSARHVVPGAPSTPVHSSPVAPVTSSPGTPA